MFDSSVTELLNSIEDKASQLNLLWRLCRVLEDDQRKWMILINDISAGPGELSAVLAAADECLNALIAEGQIDLKIDEIKAVMMQKIEGMDAGQSLSVLDGIKEQINA